MRKYKIYIVCIVLTCLLSACCKVQKTYYPKGMLESEVPYCRQKMHGRAVWYYEHGKKRMEATYDKGLLHGAMVRYYRNGAIESLDTFQLGKQNGTSLAYYLDGNLKEVYHYQDGMRNGQFVVYYENQQEQLIGYYENGQYDSLWRYFDAQGYVVGEGFFTKGKGILKRYDANGKLVQTIEFENSKHSGKEIYYDGEGNVMKRLEYKPS